MYRILCVEGRLDPITLLEELRPSEAMEHVSLLNYSDREGWEQTRMACYTIAQVNSKNTIDPKSIMKFPWDEQPQKVETTAEDIKRLKERSETIAKRLYG